MTNAPHTNSGRTNGRNNRTNIRNLTLIALMTAVTCILGPLTLPLPVSPIPLSLATFAIYLSVYILGMKKGTISCILYLLIGLAGLPVLSGFTGGVGKLLGPTGGYMIGYVVMALIAGFFIDQYPARPVLQFIGMILGTVSCYLLGTIWLGYQAGISFAAALTAGVLPFIPGDLAKMVFSIFLGYHIRKRLRTAHLISS